MSYSVPGIQAHTTEVPFYPADHASGGVIRSPLTATTVDRPASPGATTEIAKAATPAVAKVDSHLTALPVHNTAAPIDTVTLSNSDKVRELRQQGAGETQIAATLNLPLKEVQTDLHVRTQVQAHVSFTVSPVSNPLSAGVAATTGHTVSAEA